jgi:hypothetical protein
MARTPNPSARSGQTLGYCYASSRYSRLFVIFFTKFNVKRPAYQQKNAIAPIQDYRVN